MVDSLSPFSPSMLSLLDLTLLLQAGSLCEIGVSGGFGYCMLGFEVSKDAYATCSFELELG